MKSRILLCMLAILFGWGFTPLESQNKSEALDAMIREGMAAWQIPGLVATVVHDGEVVFEKAYGVRNLESGARVDRQTLFNMGSTTKAVVSLALGILVDRGKLNWEDKVYQHLPEFQLSDPYIREEARVMDLLTHNLGIDEADLLWVLDSTSTQETIRHFAGAEKTFPVRGGFVYNNLMYVVAGEVIEAASGKPWYQFVEEEIFRPLEMTHTVARATEMVTIPNRATPYLSEPEKGILQAPYTLSDQIGAAGMIYTCLEDVQHYLLMLEQGGMYGGKALVTPETFAFLFEPKTLIGAAAFYPTRQLTRPNWLSYGLGWFQHDYLGHKLDFHTGSITGLIAIAGIMHDRNTAVYVMANLDHAELRHAILYKAMDLWALEAPDRDWQKEIYALYDGFRQEARQQESDLVARRQAGTSPRLALAAYAGTYTHPMLGEARVAQTPGGLDLIFNDYATFRLKHWHYDTFRSDSSNRYLTRLMVNFGFGTDGAVSQLKAMGKTFMKATD